MMKNLQKRIAVAVVGGGASGWSAIRALNEASNSDVKFETTIFEKRDRWGGKCCTVIPNDIPVDTENDGKVPTNPNERKYEMGAGAISGSFSMPTENYADILKYLKELDFGISLIECADRQNYVYYKNSTETSLAPFGTLLRNIYQFLKLKYDISKNYTSNTLEYKDMLSKYPLLSQHLSERYPNPAVLEVLAKAGQGYGYADQDDPYLTAPLLYFLDFIKSEQAKSPLYSVDQGMQEIWSKTAEKYSQQVQQRLGETVVRVNRNDKGISLKTDKNSGESQFDKLIIATPLIQAQFFMDYTGPEQDFLAKVKYNHYVTVLCKVDVEKDAVGWVNLPNCVDRSKRGQLVFSYKPYSDSPWMVHYLYIKKGTTLSDEMIVDQVAKNLKEDLNARLIEKESAIVRHWNDYFAHLDKEGLESNWYEKFDKDFQNKKNTLYVGTPLHMESLGQSVKYAYAITQKTTQRWIQECNLISHVQKN